MLFRGRLTKRIALIALVLAMLATGTVVIAASSASVAFAASDDAEVLVTAAGTSAYLVIDDVRYRASPTCRVRLLELLGRDPQVVPWSTIAAIPEGPRQWCNLVLGRLVTNRIDPQLLATSTGANAHVIDEGVRYRANAACRAQLTEAVGAPNTVPWRVIAAAPAAAAESCDALLDRFGIASEPRVVYANNFSSVSDSDRLDSFVAYRDDFVVTHETGQSDHAPTSGAGCSGPGETRPQERNNPWAHVYLCHPNADPALGHMMGYAMDTSGYGFVGGLPDQVFEGVRSVEVDVNTTSAGGRNFVEIKVLPAAQTFVDGLPCGPDLPCNDGWDYDDIGGVGASTDSQEGTGLAIHTAAQPDGYFFDEYNYSEVDGDIHFAQCSGDEFCFRAALYEANPDIRDRHRHVFQDNGDGTLSFGIADAEGVMHWVAAPGSFPEGPVRVVIAFHNYTGTKSGNGPGFENNESPSVGGFTWHWDNLSVVAESATPSEVFFNGNSASRMVTPDGCIAFVQGQRNLPGNRDIAPSLHCEGDRLGG